MKLSVCIDAVYRGTDAVAAMARAKEAGAEAYEFWTWWDKDLPALREQQEQLGLTPATFCTKFTSLVEPAQRDAYLEGLKQSLAAAKLLGCRSLITQTGAELAGVPREEQRRSLVDGLKLCVPLLEEAGVTLLVEPLNTAVNHPGYYLTSSAEAFGIIDEVGSPNVKVLYDIYHQQITEGDLIRTIQANIDRIGHFHAAGHPGRHELDVGEIHYPAVFKAIAATGYTGYVGLEYFGLREPDEGLKEQVVLWNDYSAD